MSDLRGTGGRKRRPRPLWNYWNRRNLEPVARQRHPKPNLPPRRAHLLLKKWPIFRSTWILLSALKCWKKRASFAWQIPLSSQTHLDKTKRSLDIELIQTPPKTHKRFGETRN